MKLSPMREGYCPRCGSEQVKRGDDIDGKEGLHGSNRLPLSATMHVPIDNFICPRCGYLESYLTDRDALRRIANDWQRVTPDSDNADNAQ